MKNRHHVRYYDDMTRERLIYYNGEYYKMREEFLSGGPYTVPRLIWDPYGPWRMARPVQHPMRYWTDLDYRYQHRVKEAVTKFRNHYVKDGHDNQIDGLMIAPLGSYVTVKQVPQITIKFGDSNFNYTVEVDSNKVYRLDYLADGTLSTVIGKITDSKTYLGTDYRGKDTYYVILTIDCSSDFGSDIRYVDSRDIRYICPLSDLQSNVSITNTYIGVDEPDSEEYGGWYNPITQEYYILRQDEWVKMPNKPSDAPEGKYYRYDIENMEWVLDDVPPMPSTYRRNQIWVFDEERGYWESTYVMPKPKNPPSISLTNEYLLDRYIGPCMLDESKVNSDTEIYYNVVDNAWDYRSIQPESPNIEHLVYLFDHGHREWVGVHQNTKTLAEDQIAFYDFKTMEWIIVDKNDHPEVVESPDFFSWVLYPERGVYFYMDKKYTYNIKENTWSLESDNIFNKPDTPCKEGYYWKYYSYYNTWFQTPINNASRKLPLNINGEIINRDYEYPIYGSNNSALIIDYRPNTFL